MSRVIAILALLLCAAHAQARTLYVSLTGSHDTNAPAFGTWATAATNIQAAVDAASDGDTVRVAHGTYYSDNGTNDIISITNKTGLSVIGGNGTLFDADKTILDAGGSSTINPIVVNAVSNRVAGFTAMNTKAQDAVLLSIASANCTLDSLIVRNNDMSGTGYGCGIKNIGGPGNEIRNCIVVGNAVGTVVGMSGIYNQIHLSGVGIAEVHNCISEGNTKNQICNHNGILSIGNSIYGNTGGTIADLGGNITNNTTNSVCRLLDIAPASDGVGTNLQWAGVSAYIPRLGSLARKNGQPYAGIETASDGAGGPALVTSRPFLGRDATTNLNHGAAIGGVTASTNSPFAGESSAAFDGASGYVNCGSSINILTNDFTLEVFVKTTNLSVRGVAGKPSRTLKSGRFAFFLGDDGKINFYLSPASGTIILTSPEVVADGSWRHAAGVVKRSENLVLFIDGAPVATNSTPTPGNFSTADKFSIGENDESGRFQGNLSEVRIWSVARTPEQIAANYTNRLTGTEPGLVGYWPLKDPAINPVDTGPFNLDNPIIHPTYMEAF